MPSRRLPQPDISGVVLDTPVRAPMLRVSSNLARQVLLEARRLAGLEGVSGWGRGGTWTDYEADWMESDLTPPIFEERMRIRALLRGSGLAQLLPAGLDALPDYYGALPWILRSLARLLQPRNLRHLVRHVAGNLDWYLDQSKSAVPWRRFFFALAAPITPAAMLLVGAGLIGPGQFLVDWGFWIFVAAFVGTIGGIAWYFAHDVDRMRDKLNALELYIYLRDEYCDQLEAAG